MPPSRAYWRIPIHEGGEPLMAIPLASFAYSSPHDYEALGAPYGDASPYYVRASVLEALHAAQEKLVQLKPNWRLYIFDAYRPLAVQEFMAGQAFQELLTTRNLDPNQLTSLETDELWAEVYTIWAPANRNPLTPPPHSTGGAVDVTLYDQALGACVDMGSPIDELSARSQPNYFDQRLLDSTLSEEARARAEKAVENRQILYEIMRHADFQRHPGEWWHFCLGDQMWVWLSQKQDVKTARYGRYELLNSHSAPEMN